MYYDIKKDKYYLVIWNRHIKMCCNSEKKWARILSMYLKKIESEGSTLINGFE